MSKASLSDGAGPGSSISLAPETIRVRNALIEKFSGAPLDEMKNFMTMALSNETDELRRLGILAARIYLLRSRVASLKEFNRDSSMATMPEIDTTTLSLSLPGSDLSANEQGSGMMTPELGEWSTIQMTEPGEVNGVRFLAGTIIDAQPEDAEKLIRSGKAVRVDENGNVVGPEDDDFKNSDDAAPPTAGTTTDDSGGALFARDTDPEEPTEAAKTGDLQPDTATDRPTDAQTDAASDAAMSETDISGATDTVTPNTTTTKLDTP